VISKHYYCRTTMGRLFPAQDCFVFPCRILGCFLFSPRPRWIELIFVFDIRAALLGIIRNSDFVLIFSAQFPPFKPTSAPSSFFPHNACHFACQRAVLIILH